MRTDRRQGSPCSRATAEMGKRAEGEFPGLSDAEYARRF